MIAEETLLHANLRALSDPDPDRAFRFRPFVYGSVRDAARLQDAAPPVAVRRGIEALQAAALAAVSRVAPVARPTSASPGPACC